ncbi:LuxR C-terminal-related transcriptional regulator [Leifsonia sp. NPDC058248]|uniref:LuxR C-terminal-related transcriptional regulator n=1 Tax=Leifsonia sp. NPDC058248 TaxID=3346402 RepID=UPI0036DAEBA9
MPSIAALDALANARTAFADRRWDDAFVLLSAADRERPLDLADLELYGKSASLTARDDEAFAILERGYDQCLAAGDEKGAAGCAFWLGFRMSSLGEQGRAGGWLARSAVLVDHLGDCAERGYLLVPRIHQELRVHHTEAAYELAQEAAACGDRFGEADLSALARQLGGRARIEQGDVAGGMRLLDEAMLVATTGTVTELGRGLVYCSVIGCCQRVFAVDRAREWSDVLDSWCASQAQLGIFNGTCRVHRAELLRFGGAWAAALDEAQLVAAGMKADERERAAATYEEAEIRRLRGELQKAEDLYEHTSRRGVDPQPGLALLRLAQGDVARAAGAIRRASGTSGSDLGRMRFLPAAVEILLAAGATAEAEDAAAELSRIAAAYGTPVLDALAQDAAGRVLLGSGEAASAVPRLTDALEAWLELGAPYAAARVRALLAEAFASLGDSEGARQQRDAASAVFTELGAATDLAALRSSEVALSGGDADHGPTGGALSTRELQVLRLAATGRTNKEIATDLGLSPRTVDRHIGNLLAKLGVPSRAAATAYAYEHDLIRR